MRKLLLVFILAIAAAGCEPVSSSPPTPPKIEPASASLSPEAQKFYSTLQYAAIVEYQRAAAEWYARVLAFAAAVEAARQPSEPHGVWDRLAGCESGGNWSINTGNGYYGGLQFSPSSWRAVGGSGLPHQHSREEQINRGRRLQAIQGWGAWPACSRKLGLR